MLLPSFSLAAVILDMALGPTLQQQTPTREQHNNRSAQPQIQKLQMKT
jgi:hypothetical protein